jgi:hypothetical protein
MKPMMLLMVSLGFTGGAIARALFVASLAVIAFVLARYWRRLEAQPKQVRYALVSLRGVALLLLAMAIAGVHIDYDAVVRPRVLVVKEALRTDSQTDAKRRSQDEAVRRVIARLKANGIDGTEPQAPPQAPPQADASESPTPFLAGLLVSDGAMHSQDARNEVTRVRNLAAGSPVYVLTDFSASNEPQIALENVTVLSHPARGVPFSIRCAVRARGAKGRSTLVTIADESQVRSSARAEWASDDERQIVTLEVVPKVEGWNNYVVRVESAGSGDAPTGRFAVYVSDRRGRVLFIEGEPTWEAKFIRRALQEAELFEVDYFAQVSKIAIAGADEPSGEDAGAKTSGPDESPIAKLHGILANAARLNSYDVVVFGATPDSMLSNAEATRVRDWAERRGGGLVILGGNAFAGSVAASNAKLNSILPAELESGTLRTAPQTIRDVPVEADRPRNRVALTPTQAGAGGPLRGFLDASEGSKNLAVLSGESRLGTLRTGASVLAVSATPGADGTSESGSPLMVARRFGAGRTMIFAPADSYRMRTGASGEGSETDGPFASLWQGIVLWASATARPPVELTLSAESPEAGSEVVAELTVRDEAYASLNIERVNAQLLVSQEGAEQATQAQQIAFAPDATESGIWRGRFIAPQPGRFTLKIEYVAAGRTGSAEKYFAVVTPNSPAPGAGRDALQRLARENGGELFSEAELDAFVDRIAKLPHAGRTARASWELRTWWPLALIIPLLLSAEWLLLKIRSKSEGELAFAPLPLGGAGGGPS